LRKFHPIRGLADRPFPRVYNFIWEVVIVLSVLSVKRGR
jgi:hypothetical protein